jgi:cellulose synthase/poly-beta-1,6-N-acetylglucosamine synthase-like glycosyltransferase
MLTAALSWAALLLAVTTILLVTLGTRPLGRPVRALGLVAVPLAATASVEGAAVALATAALALALPRRWYAAGAWLFAALLVTSALYAVYLVRATVLLGGGPLSYLLGLLLLFLELGAMGLITASAFEMVDAVCAATRVPRRPPDPDGWPVVCLQVPTYNEPPDLVIETVRSLVALEYPALQVQVIDNNTSDEALWQPVDRACARLRDEGHDVRFVHLPEWPGYKAGALNWGLSDLPDDVEVVGVVDADYIVDPAWLRETIPYFVDPSVAFVQTPQDYREWETSAFYRACHAGFAYFFKVGMVSRANRNAIIFAGTMGLIRRSVLDDVGGWDERIITEDAEISLRVLARGHRSVYVPRAFGHGIMPLTYEALRKQRFRWAFGGIQILRRHWRTLLDRRSGLTLGQRYDHLLGGLWWFNDALTLGFTVFVAVAAVGAIVGRPFIVQRLTGLGLVLPAALLGLNLVRYLWGLGVSAGVRPPLALAALRVNLSLSWVIALACYRGLTQERGVFLRTPKFAGAASIRELRVVWVETLIAAAGSVLFALLVLQAGFSVAGASLAVLLGWSLLIYASAVGYALGDPARAPVADILRDKARLEMAPAMGRVARSRPARAGVAMVVALIAVGVVIANESQRPAVAELPFQQVPVGPVGREPAQFPSPAPLPAGSAGDATASPTGSPAPASVAAVTPGPGRSPAPPPPTGPPSPTPSATPTASPSPPGPGRTPPVPVPTPGTTSRPTPVVSPPPHPTPSFKVP